MHGALGTQDIQAIASTLQQQHQLQSLQQQLQQFAMFQANPAAGQISPFFLQNQVGARVITMFHCELRSEFIKNISMFYRQLSAELLIYLNHKLHSVSLRFRRRDRSRSARIAKAATFGRTI